MIKHYDTNITLNNDKAKSWNTQSLNAICHNPDFKDFTMQHEIQDKVYELLNWIDTDLSNYVEYFNGIQSKINSATNL